MIAIRILISFFYCISVSYAFAFLVGKAFYLIFPTTDIKAGALSLILSPFVGGLIFVTISLFSLYTKRFSGKMVLIAGPLGGILSFIIELIIAFLI